MSDAQGVAFELFHELTQADSAAVRRQVVNLQLEEHVGFRNIGFESHLTAFNERGGSVTPAIWDGERLHQGREAALAALALLASR